MQSERLLAERPQELFARRALTDSGWQQDVRVTIDGSGTITGLTANAAAASGVTSYDLLLPGMANVHSHSFQRAMAGLTETASGNDNFWGWRQVMYRFASALTPEQIEIITRALYIELLKSGFTSVGEFHYLHHDASGKAYGDITELSQRIFAAAQDTGIHLTHLPVMYETSSFGGIPASDEQKRFIHNADDYLTLLEALVRNIKGKNGITLGIAPHSLRAVTPDALKAILGSLPKLGLGNCPIHIHVAEQEKEVNDCLSWSKQRPVEWLFNHADVDARWCLIHATHITQDEVSRIASSGAVAGLCPTTEANLGDGVFPAESFLAAGGKFAIGTDSHVGVSPWEELRLLEYAQRLRSRTRAVLCDTATPSVGRTLFSRAAAGGAQALGLYGGILTKGARADMVTFSMDNALLASKEGDQILDTLMFGGICPPVRDVFVAGKRVIANGKHIREDESNAALRDVIAALVK